MEYLKIKHGGTKKIESRKILVTGGLGFIGSHTVELFHKWHPKTPIVILDACTYAVLSSTRKIIESLDNVEIVEGNLTDFKLVQDLMSKHAFTHVLHFAAESHVGNSFDENSLTFTMTNVLGTHTLLEAWRLSKHREKLELFVHVSTDEVHGTVKEGRRGEEAIKKALLLPTNPYAASKAAAEMQIHAYKTSYGLPAVITRGNNVYGPRQHSEKLIPRTLLHTLKKEVTEIHGDGEQKRSFIYIADVARAFACMLDSPKEALKDGVVLIGSHSEYTVIEVVRDAATALKEDVNCEFVKDPRPFNDKRYLSGMSACIRRVLVDHSISRELTTWEVGMAQTARWYQKHVDEFR